MYPTCLSSGTWTTNPYNLAVGDLVFYSYGGTPYHVAMYVGGGQVVHANGYGTGVVVTDVYYDDGFIGGGSVI
jgi:cell wall-associated NlpC family hydrolase